MIRAKFYCASIQRMKSSEPGLEGNTVAESIRLEAVIDENKEWSRWTPSGTLTMHVTNPNVFGQIKEGQMVFVDLTPIP